MSGQFNISESLSEDQHAIEHLLDLTFGLGRRTKTSYRLREGSRPVEGLSLVIRDDKLAIAGAISFWPLRIGAEGRRRFAWTLAVHPGGSIGDGLSLMRDGLARAKAMCFTCSRSWVGDEPD